jgi:hypothetical protein
MKGRAEDLFRLEQRLRAAAQEFTKAPDLKTRKALRRAAIAYATAARHIDEHTP